MWKRIIQKNKLKTYFQFPNILDTKFLLLICFLSLGMFDLEGQSEADCHFKIEGQIFNPGFSLYCKVVGFMYEGLGLMF